MVCSRKNVILFASLASVISAYPVRREVPQEHSHNAIIALVSKSLNLNNLDKIVDPIFGLLGNAAATAGLGAITDPDCLQQATADQAFSNAKAAKDVAGMTAALQYIALERNTGKVGLQSVKCTKITAKNPEIAALSQHQDPASAGAAAFNKALVLTLAKQIASIGGNPQDALATGTFAPGDVNDNTGKGNTCDTADDTAGCINTLKLLVEDATPAEIDAAVAGTGTGTAAVVDTGAAAVGAADPAATSCSLVAVTVTVTAPAAAATSADPIVVSSAAAAVTTSAAPAAATTSVAAVGASSAAVVSASPSITSAAAVASATASAASGAATSGNLQTFTGAVGSAPPPVTAGGRGFVVSGSDFLNVAAALGRSCDIQHNSCANAANSSKSFSVTSCDAQNTSCHAAITA